MKNETGIIGTTIAALIAICVLAISFSFSHVLWPLLRLAARLLWKGIKLLARKARAKIHAPKAKAPAPTLFTPEIFRGRTDLAPAKEIRLN
jgi:predicted tellurium resistance membrane protein TerC